MNSQRNISQIQEHMDDFMVSGSELIKALDNIALINKLLGGNRLTLNALKKVLKATDKAGVITIADIGCGNGDMLRLFSDYGRKNNIKFKLIGVDANQNTLDYATRLSEQYSDISYICLDVFDKSFETVKYDIVVSTLTMHHFDDGQIVKIMDVLYTNCSVAIIVNDLERSRLSYSLFKIIAFVFQVNRMTKEDGLLSIKRGFKKKELVNYSKKLNHIKFHITWKWAFRYEWIITKV